MTLVDRGEGTLGRQPQDHPSSVPDSPAGQRGVDPASCQGGLTGEVMSSANNCSSPRAFLDPTGHHLMSDFWPLKLLWRGRHGCVQWAGRG